MYIHSLNNGYKRQNNIGSPAYVYQNENSKQRYSFMSTNKDKIIRGCIDLFFKYGIRSITVDDICNDLRISKKTFYLIFKNKDDVIELISKEFINKNRIANRETIEGHTDVIQKILRIYKQLLEQFHTCNPRFIYDIKKYYPEIYELFTEYGDKDLGDMITNLLQQGKEEKIFRTDLDEKIIFRLHIHLINTIIDGTLLPEKHITNPDFLNVMIFSLIGISTIKGHELIQQKICNI